MTESSVTHPTYPTKSQTNSSVNYRFYTGIQQVRLDNILEELMENDNDNTFVPDLFDLLGHTVAQCNCITQNDILTLLKLSESPSWNRHMIHRLHCILRQDLRIRPNKFNSVMMDELHRFLDICLQLVKQINNDRGSGIKLQCVHLALNYFVKVLIRYCSSLSNDDTTGHSILDRTTKWPFYSKIIKLIFNISDLFTIQEGNDSIIYQSLQNDLFLLLCVPMCSNNSPDEIAQRIAFFFEGQLREIESIPNRRHIIQLIPSLLLKEKIIDTHLTEEFTFHPSLTILDSDICKPFNLNKFCIIHLCRMPNGVFHSLSYFLFLLYSLLEAHLMLLTGIQPLSPISSLKRESIQQWNEFKPILESIKPHIAGLVDRLSEDEVLLRQLMESDCLCEIQSLSSIIDTIMTSLLI